MLLPKSTINPREIPPLLLFTTVNRIGTCLNYSATHFYLHHKLIVTPIKVNKVLGPKYAIGLRAKI